jgi:hypothetical protein
MKYLSNLDKLEADDVKSGLGPEEEILMQVLKYS